MNLNYRQQHQLRRIEVGLRRADPHLGAMFGVFGRLYPYQRMPAWEQQPRMPSGQHRIPRAVRRLRGGRRRGHGDRILISKPSCRGPDPEGKRFAHVHEQN